MEKRLKVSPGSEEDTVLYLQAKAIDELFNLFDTVDTQAAAVKKNRDLEFS